MAKVNGNVVIQDVSGAVGRQLVLRHDKAGRTIMAAYPRLNPNRVYTPAQVAQQQAFREAVTYGHAAQTNPAYINKAKGTPCSPYNLAVADWFRPPEIAGIDLSSYTGQAGQVIRVKALDDVLVKSVTLIITDENGTVLEQGPASSVDALEWQYTTKAAATGSHPTIQATALDLPGHSHKMDKMK